MAADLIVFDPDTRRARDARGRQRPARRRPAPACRRPRGIARHRRQRRGRAARRRAHRRPPGRSCAGPSPRPADSGRRRHHAEAGHSGDGRIRRFHPRSGAGLAAPGGHRGRRSLDDRLGRHRHPRLEGAAGRGDRQSHRGERRRAAGDGARPRARTSALLASLANGAQSTPSTSTTRTCRRSSTAQPRSLRSCSRSGSGSTSPGADALAAFIAGFEVETRIGRVIGAKLDRARMARDRDPGSLRRGGRRGPAAPSQRRASSRTPWASPAHRRRDCWPRSARCPSPCTRARRR